MFKWIKRKWKDRKREQEGTPRPEVTRIDTMGAVEGDHVYEEIADPTLCAMYESRQNGKRIRPHATAKIQRSISFQNILHSDKRSSKNGFFMSKYNSSERLPPIGRASVSSSLMNTPTNSTSNLSSRDVTFTLLPENAKDGMNFRAMPLHQNVYLPRKSATFASADTEVCRKRGKFQNRQHDAEVYATTGSDSGYGFSNYNSNGSNESDTSPHGNYDAYAMKMEELLRLEKEVRNILKTIRGDDEPDDGYQNSRYFQEDERFRELAAPRQCEPEVLSRGYNAPPMRPKRHSSMLVQHLPLRRVSNKSNSPQESYRGVHPRVNSPLPAPPDNRTTGNLNRNQNGNRDSISSTPSRSRTPVSDIYLVPTPNRLSTSSPTANFVLKQSISKKSATPALKRIVTSSTTSRRHSSSSPTNQCSMTIPRYRTQTNEPYSSPEPRGGKSTPLMTRKMKQIAPKIQDKAHLPMSLHTNQTHVLAHGSGLKDAVCLECSKRGGNTPRLRQRPLAPEPQWNSAIDYCNNDLFRESNFNTTENNNLMSEQNRQRPKSFTSLM